ncbi:MAG: alpha/beta hydrolase family protein [Nitriliruptoraceae bacterium]
MRRALLWVVLPLTLLVVGGLGVGGWYYSDQLLPAPPPWEPVPELSVTAVDPDAGSLSVATTDGDAILPQVGFVSELGLLAANGDPVVSGTDLTRTVTLLDGDWPEVGEMVATTVDTFWGDPATTLGVAFDTIDVASEVGDLPAWRVVPRNATTNGTWVVIVHGRGGALSEGNRLLPLLDELGLPSLTLSVRNDPDAPADPDGFGYFGEREWQEIEAAIDHLVEVEQAEQVVLAGYSQGASSALSLLRRSDRADRVAGALLVSPLVSLDATLDLQARNRGIPELVIPALLTSARWISSWRSGLDFDQVEHAERADELPADVPLLLTHGTADTTIPIEPTRELAALLGPQATYAEYPDVDHVREWNQDAARFEADLRELLEDVTG